MATKAHLIKRIEELEAKKKELEASQEPVIETSDPEPCADMPEPEKSPLGAGETPESLNGMSLMDIQLLYADGQMTKNEEKWFLKRTMPDAFPPGAYDWMR